MQEYEPIYLANYQARKSGERLNQCKEYYLHIFTNLMCYCLSVKPIVIFTSTLSLSTIFSRRYAKQTGCLDPVSHTNFRKLMCHMYFEQYVMYHKFNPLTPRSNF